jgi:hypothetical protein
MPKQAAFTPEEEAELTKAEEEANAKAKAELEAGSEVKTKEAEGEQPSDSESAPGETKAPSEGTETKPKGEGEATEEEFTRLSEKAQKRFRALSARAKRVEELEKQVLELEREKSEESPLFTEPQETEEPEDEREQVSEGLPWEIPSEPREVSEEEFSQEVDKKASEKAKKMVSDAIVKYDKATTAYRQLQVDLDLVEAEFDELNPGKRDLVTNEIIEANPNYNQNLAIKVRDYYKAQVKENPNLRLITFVRELMDLRIQGAEQAKKEITSEVAKQAANQALTPSGASGPSGGEDLTTLLNKVETMEDLDKVEKLLPHADR